MSSVNIDSTVTSSNCAEVCEHEPLTNADIIQITKAGLSTVNGSTLFALKYRILPCELNSRFDEDKQSTEKYHKPGMYHATSVLGFLAEEYELDPNEFLYDHTYDTLNESSVMSSVYIDLNNHLSILLSNGFRSTLPNDNPNGLKPDSEGDIFHCFKSVTIYHVPRTASQAQSLLKALCKFKLYSVPDVVITNVNQVTIKMVCSKGIREYEMTSIQIKKPEIADLDLHYGDNFSRVHEVLRDILQIKDSTGITIFHGHPGTGKTNYLRYLINEIKDKELIYVPPDLITNIRKPDFLPFLMKRPNSILIIEDAEDVLLDRSQGNHYSKEAVSNLLDLSDGLLGANLGLQIICTFNCSAQSIDRAFRREGRLVLEHKFDKLSVENARRLCEELGIPGDGGDIRVPMTLAEIYARKQFTTNNLDEKIQRLFEIKRQLSTPQGLYN